MNYSNYSLGLSDNAKGTFVKVAESLKIETTKVKFEVVLEQLHEALKNKDVKTLDKWQRSCLNSLNFSLYSDKRKDRETRYTTDKPGVCQYVKVRLVYDTINKGIAVFSDIAKDTVTLFGGTYDKQLKKCLDQSRMYMPKQMQVYFEVDKVKGTAKCINTSYAITKVDKSLLTWTKKDITK